MLYVMELNTELPTRVTKLGVLVLEILVDEAVWCLS